MALRTFSRPAIPKALCPPGCLLILGIVVLLLLPSVSSAQQGPDAASARNTAEKTSDGTDDGLQYTVRTSSPKETLSTFQRLREQTLNALIEYRETPDQERARPLRFAVDQWHSLIDLSQVPKATRREVGTLTASYLMDIFDRIPPPGAEDVPDSTAYTSDGAASYLVPHTPFRIVRIDSGPMQGEFLFSAQTVESAPTFFRTIEFLPLRSTGEITSWNLEFRQFAGPLIPAALIKAVPDHLKRPLLGTPIWKIIAVLVLTAIAAPLLFVWKRLTTHTAWGSPAGERWRMLLSPLAVMLAAFSLRHFFSTQLVLVGPFATAVYATATVLVFLAMGWAFWVFVLAIFETLILEDGLPEQNFDTSMLRLIARIIGVIGATAILAYGAQDIGLPVLSLLAGLGIGGLAVALAIRPTLENLIGGFILYLDKPIRVGDFCSFGDNSGTVESIGVRSTQIRALDRTLITVPNAQFADMQLVNWAQCDRMLIKQTIGLRYETDVDQLRYLIVKLREMLIGHPRIDSESIRVRFGDYGESSLDVDIRIYAMTREWNDFFAIKEDILFRIKTIVEQSGSGFAFPSQTLYMSKDDGLDTDLSEKARQQVSAWRHARELPFPHFGANRMEQLDGRLSYPPPGSPDFNATPEELADAGGERLSAEPLQEESEAPTGENVDPKKTADS